MNLVKFLDLEKQYLLVFKCGIFQLHFIHLFLVLDILLLAPVARLQCKIFMYCIVLPFETYYVILFAMCVFMCIWERERECYTCVWGVSWNIYCLRVRLNMYDFLYLLHLHLYNCSQYMLLVDVEAFFMLFADYIPMNLLRSLFDLESV